LRRGPGASYRRRNLPLVDNVSDVIAELNYCANIGFKTVLLQGFPSGKPYPSQNDDVFWHRALELDMPISVHVDLDRTGDARDRSSSIRTSPLRFCKN
jgi:predicted TIM-barrel fold metal-dependent hydrolase